MLPEMGLKTLKRFKIALRYYPEVLALGGLGLALLCLPFAGIIGTPLGYVVGFQEIVAQIAHEFPQTVVFAFKPQGSELSKHLNEAVKRHQVQRLDVDVLETGAWEEVMTIIKASI